VSATACRAPNGSWPRCRISRSSRQRSNRYGNAATGRHVDSICVFPDSLDG
jgi:hypothetical protein